MSDWYDDIAFPLHAALDEATDMDGATTEQRWARVMERCPWLMERVCTAPATDMLGVTKDGWFSLKSSNLDAMKVEYTPTEAPQAILTVRFKNGTIYRYEGVTEEDITGLRTAESPGGYFNTFIKGKYASEKVAG